MASEKTCCSPPQEDDWDDYLHGMFKKLKMDPERSIRKTRLPDTTAREDSQWYRQPVKTTKKTRKSVTLRSARNRLSPYKTSFTCHAGKLTCEGSLIRSSSFNSFGKNSIESGLSKVWSDFGQVSGRFSPSIENCSCAKKWIDSCDLNLEEQDIANKCGREIRDCQFGSSCKSKLTTFRTLATIVEESGEILVKEETDEEITQKPSSSESGATKAAVQKKDDKVVSDASAVNIMLPFRKYRDNSTAKDSLASSTICFPIPQGQVMAAPCNSARQRTASVKIPQITGHVEARVPLRPEYSCSQEAKMAEDGLLDDTSVDDLAGYFDSMVYIPRKMSAMAEMMYT
ncbi:uncharacterized protein [Diadema antillarum]|uniref:uncharacterized protein n=1 Tax=Diadema antillarum TaxID=105358 RepID=UPI003A8AD788